MAFSTQDSEEALSEINITPLVDVMLVLLVAFIVTIPVINNAVHISLPKTVQTTPPDLEKPVTVSVDKDSRVWLDRRQVPVESLERELLALKAARPDVALQLQGDETAPYGPVAKTMAAIEHAGITHLSVLTAQQ